MTPNDTQMDVLMRRYAKHASEPSVSKEHLDADELNAFAEGSLPAAARSQYASHLADCGDCRKLATQLAIASGAAAHARVPVSESVEQRSWWQKLRFVLAPSALRYAAFAAVLLTVSGIGFMVWRQSREPNSDLLARRAPVLGEGERPQMTDAQRAPNEGTPAPVSEPRESAQATPGAKLDSSGPSTTTVNPAPPPKPEAEVAKTADAAAPPAEQLRAAASPSYAPQPASEYRVDTQSRQQQNTQGVAAGGPRRNESSEKYKMPDRGGYSDLAKARSGDEERGRTARNQPGTIENKQEEADLRVRDKSTTPAAPRRTTDDERVMTRKSDAAESAKDEEASQTRSVGGRKFQRQGNAWVDVKFKSSMSVRNVARSSDTFADLDSGLRSIAQQLGGEVVVVWKGKAYRIK